MSAPFLLGTRRRCAASSGAFVVALAGSEETIAAGLAEKGAKGEGVIEILASPDLQVKRSFRGAAPTALALEGNTLVSALNDGAVRLWDLRNKGKSPARELRPAGEDPAPCVALRDGRCAVAASWGALLLDASTGKEIASYDYLHSSSVTCVGFHPARPSVLVTGGDDGLLCVLDTTQRTEEETLRLAINVEESVRSLSFVGQGSDLLCSFSTTEALQLWNLSDRRFGERLGRLEALRSERRLQVGESDGNLLDVLYNDESGRAYVLAGTVKGKLLLYHLNLEGASYAADLTDSGGGHNGMVRASVTLGPHFATGGEDGHVCLWRAATGGNGGDAAASGPPPAKRRKGR